MTGRSASRQHLFVKHASGIGSHFKAREAALAMYVAGGSFRGDIGGGCSRDGPAGEPRKQGDDVVEVWIRALEPYLLVYLQGGD